MVIEMKWKCAIGITGLKAILGVGIVALLWTLSFLRILLIILTPFQVFLLSLTVILLTLISVTEDSMELTGLRDS